MKKFFKALALVLALALVIGVVPAQATSAKIKAKKTLYVDGAKGTSTDGKLTSSYKSKVAIYKLAGDKKSVAADHTYKAVIKSGDSVTKSKKYVYASALGKSVVEIFKDGESLGTSVITVKKNATEDTLTITELEDGKEVVCGVKYTVTLPRKGVDTDERRLFVDDKAVEDKEDAPRAYEVVFTKAGDHKVKFEAFQSAALDKATASKEITVKAVMPQPVSAKQVSANSFAVEFEGNMEGLISKDDITNQMIYYLIAKEPVVTGVIKSVEVKDAVVTVTMYSNFNPDTDYYFAYGNVDAIKFHTAKNELKYATELRLVEATAYYVGEDTPIEYKFFNADGVELLISDIPAFTVESDYAYNIGANIYFHSEGTAKIKATITTGYDDETNVPITLSSEITVTGVKKTATQTGKLYSFDGNADNANHTIRMNAAASGGALSVKYTLSDGTKETVTVGTTPGYYIKSTDETVVMINQYNRVYGVNTGSATIVMYDADDKVVDAFAITVLEANKAYTATAELSKGTLNRYAAANDSITLSINVKDLDNNDTDAYTVTVKQLDNNSTATNVALDTLANGAAGVLNQTFTITRNNLTDQAGTTSEFSTIRLVVTIKDTTSAANTILSKTLSFAASTQNQANSYKLNASKTSLDNSLKNWKNANLANSYSDISVEGVKTSSYGDFHVTTEDFTLVQSVGSIPATHAADTINYVIRSYPDMQSDGSGNAAVTNTGNSVTIKAFPDGSTRAKNGTYSFTGYHVVYGADTKGVRTSLGAANVTVSKSDVQATVAVLDGTAAAFETNVATVASGAIAPATSVNVFKITWDGLTTNHTSGQENTGRVKVNKVYYSKDSVTNSYYVSKINAAIEIDDGSYTTHTFYQDIVVNKLFKD